MRDEDGQGTLRLNGVTLSNFARLGSDLWQTGDGRFRVARSESAGEQRLLIVHTTTGVLGHGQDVGKAPRRAALIAYEHAIHRPPPTA